MMRRSVFLATATVATAIGGDARASETITYTYDELGRLVQTTSTGSVNNGLIQGIAYDAAGNRTNYSITGSTGIAALHDPAANVAWAWVSPLPQGGGAVVLDPATRAHRTAFLRAVSSGGDALFRPEAAVELDSAGEPASPGPSPF